MAVEIIPPVFVPHDQRLKVKKATVYTGLGPDKVILILDAKQSFPSFSDSEPKATIETAAGYGRDWVRSQLGIEPQLISLSNLR
jgi:hypothetical protein